MARPKKIGLEYFPLDCRMDDKVEMLEIEYGLVGFAVYIKLLQEIYQTEDGKLDMSLVFRWKTLGRRMGIEVKQMEDIVNLCLEVGLFCKVCFLEEKKLTSNGVRSRLRKVSDLRNRDRGRKKADTDGILTENQGIPSENQRIITQKEMEREKEKKRKKEIEEEKRKKESKASKKIPFDIFWDAYDKKRERGDCEVAWDGLSLSDQELAMIDIPKYRAEQPDRKYRKHPIRYIKRKLWTDGREPEAWFEGQKDELGYQKMPPPPKGFAPIGKNGLPL